MLRGKFKSIYNNLSLKQKQNKNNKAKLSGFYSCAILSNPAHVAKKDLNTKIFAKNVHFCSIFALISE